MKRVIQIKHTKGIENLTFPLPQQCGVYLLVGANGCGKTSILTCLYQLCYRDAFKEGFCTAAENDEVDRYTQSEIIYTGANGQSVAYGKKGKLEKRWKPTGTNGLAKQVLSSFGFSAAVFIKADHTRLTPSEAEIKKGEYVPAAKEVKEALNFIFTEEKYSHLKRLKVKNGRGKNASLFYVIQDAKRNYFYSEKRFSTGELAMLNLVEKLVKAKENTLILLDEAELALHPKVQINLLRYLNTIAAEKKLTVFVSTHSPTMIRATYPTKIMLLNQTTTRGYYEIVTPCHPAYAMGFIDELNSTAPDYIFCVEDEKALLVLRELLHQYINSQGKESLRRLRYQIIPVAGWLQTLQFVQNSHKMLFSNTCVRAVLDADVFERTDDDTDDTWVLKKSTLEPYASFAYSLGVTPELGIVQALERQNLNVLQLIRERYNTDLALFFQSTVYSKAKKANPRNEAKKKLHLILSELASHSGLKEDAILALLLPLIINDMYTPSKLAEVAGRVLSAPKK